MIDLVELNDLIPSNNQYLTNDDDIRFKAYAITQNDPELFKCLYGDDFQYYINKMKINLIFNEYVDIFQVCGYSLYSKYKER